MTWCWSRITFALSLICYSWGLNAGNQATRPRLFDHDFSAADDFQSWEDWQAKRNLGGNHWDVGQLPPGTFQNWHEWFAKRGHAIPSGVDNFGGFDRPSFQEWNNWMTKRGLDSKAAFTGFSDLDKGQFQQWSDWMSKRFYDMGALGFGHGPNPDVGMQNWDDVMKRQSFVYPSSDLSGSGNAYFQNWQDWHKRMVPDRTSALRSYKFGNNDRFIKRQLGFSPERYGSFNRYFTDGLQDWRSTFKGIKRDNNESVHKSEQH